jgi:hypothetical protein
MARVGAFGMLLVAMAVAMVASTEVEEMSEMGAAAKGPMLKKMDVASLKIIDDQMQHSKALQKEEFTLRMKLNSPPESCKRSAPPVDAPTGRQKACVAVAASPFGNHSAWEPLGIGPLGQWQHGSCLSPPP